jgi:outer membrane phospholipase A
MLRNNLQSGTENRTTVRLEWSFDVSTEARLLVQFFSGYGLNLLSYDQHQQARDDEQQRDPR